MKDFLNREAKVGDVVVGCRSKRYNELTKQVIVKITDKTVFVKSLIEYPGLQPQEKYTSDQFIIINEK